MGTTNTTDECPSKIIFANLQTKTLLLSERREGFGSVVGLRLKKKKKNQATQNNFTLPDIKEIFSMYIELKTGLPFEPRFLIEVDTVFKNGSVISQLPTNPCFPGILLNSTPHNTYCLFPKPMAAFSHNHHRNNGQR